MDVTIRLPDDLAQRLSATGGDLSRRALEALAIEEYKSGRLTSAELRRLLGFRTRMALDVFLKTHGVLLDYTLADLEQERQDLRRLGF
jgi:predicted HTH domain antitoxin